MVKDISLAADGVIVDGVKWIPFPRVMELTGLRRSTLRTYSIDRRVGFPEAKKFFSQNFYRADEVAAWIKRFHEDPPAGTLAARTKDKFGPRSRAA